MRTHQTVIVSVVVPILLALGCSKGNPPPAPVSVAPPPSQKVSAAPTATIPVPTVAPAPAQESPVVSAANSAPAQLIADQLPQGFVVKQLTPAELVTAGIGMLEYRIDRFKEDYGRFPRSLSEIGMARVNLPPGKTVSYNPATGKVQVVGQ